MGDLVRAKELALHFVRRVAFYFLHAYLVRKAEVIGTRLGVLWIFLEPLLQAVFFGTLFAVLLPSEARPENYWVFVIVGVFAVFPLMSSVSKASQGAYRLGSSPPAFGPNSKSGIVHMVTADGIMSSAFNIALLVLLSVLIGLPPGGALLLALIGLPLSALTIYVVTFIVVESVFVLRDFSRFVPILNRALFFTAGIFWTKEWVGESGGGFAENLIALNPAHHLVHQWRESYFGGSEFDFPFVLFCIFLLIISVFPTLRMARGPKIG